MAEPPNQVFVTLTPANTKAKIAFSDVAAAAIRNNGGEVLSPPHMKVGPQEYDREVLRFRVDNERNREESESATDPNTSFEEENQTLGMIWTGWFIFDLNCKPEKPSRGWLAGKGAVGASAASGTDLVLCTPAFAKKHDSAMRSLHSRFFFDKASAMFCIQRNTAGSRVELEINGKQISGRNLQALNQHTMSIRINSLGYTLQYTEYAASAGFPEDRRNFIANAGGPSVSAFDMPTPLAGMRVMKDWTFGKSLGKGAKGKVFLASNAQADIVAVKLVERNQRTASHTARQVSIYEALTALAKADEDRGRRIVQVREVIYADTQTIAPGTGFEDIGIVLVPMTPETLRHVVLAGPPGQPGVMSVDTATLFHDAILGLKFLHDNRWLHLDIKPANIGVLRHPPRAVLLDLDQAEPFRPGRTAPPTPGSKGTPNYLSPEREDRGYSTPADVWAMGVVGFELSYGYHPFQFDKNPWRDGAQYEQLRVAWQERYLDALNRLETDNRQLLHFGEVITGMIAFPTQARFDLDKVLSHASFEPWAEDGESAAKRHRT